MEVCHKFAQGHVDLQFPKWGHRVGELRRLTADLVESDMRIHKANASAVVRIKIDPLITGLPFERQRDVALHGIATAKRLLDWFLTHRAVLTRRGVPRSA